MAGVMALELSGTIFRGGTFGDMGGTGGGGNNDVNSLVNVIFVVRSPAVAVMSGSEAPTEFQIGTRWNLLTFTSERVSVALLKTI